MTASRTGRRLRAGIFASFGAGQKKRKNYTKALDLNKIHPNKWGLWYHFVL